MTHDHVADCFFRFLFSEPDDDAARALFSPDFQASSDPVVSVASVEDLITFSAITRSRIRDLSARRQITTQSGDWISACATLGGLTRADDSPFFWTGTTHLRIKDGLIVEMWNCYNMMAYFIALGALPDHFMEDLMAKPVVKDARVA